MVSRLQVKGILKAKLGTEVAGRAEDNTSVGLGVPFPQKVTKTCFLPERM